jgi:tRNA-uridine 2-sulfurtransferase
MSIAFGIRALGLCSGGLDSILSALVLRRQGIEVEWVSFETPFFSAEKARRAAAGNGIPLTVVNITTPFLEMLRNPSCGYGKHMNPCLDCHALMFRTAGEMMNEKQADFLFSGEVLGQRPMSQTSSSLRFVEKKSGFAGLILRPLSAAKLPDTLPEQKGQVKKSLLLGISGRSRHHQIALAKEFGVSDYPAPAGGCLLTDRGYSARLKDLFSHGASFTERDLLLLKYGRHFRPDRFSKIIVGRAENDNDGIAALYDPKVDILLHLKTHPGPTVLLPYGGSRDARRMAAALCAGYGKIPSGTSVDVTILGPAGPESVQAIGIAPEDTRHLLI